VIHEGRGVLRRGPSVEDARAVCVLLHGRGRSPDDVLSLAERIGDPEVAWVAPAAADNSWWPGSFLAPFAENEPWLSSALGAVDTLLHSLAVDRSRIVLGGFSQGAMLSLDVALHRSARLAGVVLMSGTLIAASEWSPRMAQLAGMPVFQSHGRTDALLPFGVAETLRDKMKTAGALVEWHAFVGGHEIPPGVLGELATFLRARIAAG